MRTTPNKRKDMPPSKPLRTYTPAKGKGGPKPKYPWTTWLDGGIYRLLRGSKGHFQCKMKTMEHQIRRQIDNLNERNEAAGKPKQVFSVFRENDPEAIVIQPHD